jgi:hypothetical protein
MSKKFFILSVFMILALAMASGCMRQAALQNLTAMPVMGLNGQSLSQAKVREAILAGVNARGWVARELTPGVITATLTVRAHRAEVDIPYDGKSYSIVYKSSSNLDYNAAEQTIHNQYNNWILYLKEDIDIRLAGMQ